MLVYAPCNGICGGMWNQRPKLKEKRNTTHWIHSNTIELPKTQEKLAKWIEQKNNEMEWNCIEIAKANKVS